MTITRLKICFLVILTEKNLMFILLFVIKISMNAFSNNCIFNLTFRAILDENLKHFKLFLSYVHSFIE